MVKKKKRPLLKYFLAFVFLILVVLLGLLLFYYKKQVSHVSKTSLKPSITPTIFQNTDFQPFPQITPHPKWATYNPGAFVVLRYPEDKWERKEVMGFDILERRGLLFNKEAVWIVSGPTGPRPFEDFLKKYNGSYSMYKYTTTKEPTPVIIDGQKALIFEAPQGIDVDFFDQKGFGTYYVEFNASNVHNFQNFKNDFFEILSTAKFQ